ncbi:hypothetical protein BDN72DRAFT_834593 [Pluteus cervinus]|uniref:Uncharacterized protein n=1 Tax=Pluteus cervinus TaxID=181527 RepID=A0ACD3B5Y8_9AGAR|nr:hypothetical protein BDN72DRAFT_834593 [Pluteus cervinus]
MFMKWAMAEIYPEHLLHIDKARTAIVRGFAAPCENSAKEPDYQILCQRHDTMPSLVIECGDSESMLKLQVDKNVWQQGSRGSVRVVIFVKYYSEDVNNQMKVDMEIWRTGQPVESISLFPDPTVPNPPKTLGLVGLDLPAEGPHLVLDDLYGGQCPPGVNGSTQLPLDLHFLRCKINKWASEAGVFLIP